MDINNLPSYFLAANSADGFINGFNGAFSVRDNWKAYLIKGGPGTGKSSFMKRVAYIFDKKGEEVKLVYCSSDIKSLDGIILPKRKIAIFDATAPHTLDCVYPGVCEEIIDLGAFWDSKVLQKEKEPIVLLTDKNKQCHKFASRLLSAMGQSYRNIMKLALLATDIDKTFDYASRLADKYLKDTGKKGKEEVAYLSAVTNSGYVFFKDTINKECENKVIIYDEFSTVSNIILSVIRDAALLRGYKIITIKNNLLPSEVIDHIIIPELSLAFCSENKYNCIDGEKIRRIRSRRFMNSDILKENKGKINFYKRLYSELLQGCVSALSKAKTVHDSLEAYYIKAMDFEALSLFTEKFIARIC